MRFSLKQLVISVALMSILLGAAIWLTRWRRVVIPEAAIDTNSDIVLTTTSESRYFGVNGLSLRITGHLGGQATLRLPWDDPDLILGPGKIAEEVSHDYYDSKAVLRYKSIDAKSGSITIEYSFW